ncbi:metallo-mystery pair system four-Cys motif protein [Archangium violaceum]|uniref:MbnP family copper-binding protein n=1 Tax=Archangium violaceum TaxID=83451 RepID=UPI001951F44F|nr:MbnP family copper-binding protein [Archangium violaceum]QRO00506.1 metallo-mystery pair system four-Cys motif protein [Archangium violaceum]
MKVPKKPLPPLLLLSTLSLLQACGGESAGKKFSVRFSPQVGEQALRCDASYPSLGKTGSTVRLIDFKMYVRDVTLVRANGEKHALALEQDGTWQRDAIALLDFEDRTGTCETGTPETRFEVVGQAPDFDDYTGLEFKVGVPEELNHLNGTTAPPPLNNDAMSWGWMNGYKFLHLDVSTSKNPKFFFHLGASGCTGNTVEGYTCAASNQTTVALSGFNPEHNQVALDLAALYADTDLNHTIDHKTDFVAGCMSSTTDPECPALFEQVGLAADGTAQTVPASFIRVR